MNDIDWIYENLKEAGLVQNQNDLSHLCGMDDSYISSRKAKGKEPSVEALAHLAFNLEAELQVLEDTIRYGEDLTADRLAAAAIIYEVKNEIFANLKAQCHGGARHE
jgi:transcriptional regulator with XRE-family HTH domain